jgi:hypothetical protein
VARETYPVGEPRGAWYLWREGLGARNQDGEDHDGAHPQRQRGGHRQELIRTLNAKLVASFACEAEQNAGMQRADSTGASCWRRAVDSEATEHVHGSSRGVSPSLGRRC